MSKIHLGVAIIIYIALLLGMVPKPTQATPTPISLSKIAFVSDRDGHNEIYLMGIDGSAQTRLTYSDKDYESMYPSWSPDGRQILYTKLKKETFDNSQLYVVNADGTNTHSITQGKYSEHDATWSPDGRYIAFAASNEADNCINPCIYEMNADGTELKNLLLGGIGVASPAYSPDGKYLAFTFWGSGLPQLALVTFTSHHEVANRNDSLTEVDIDYGARSLHLMDHADSDPAWLPNSRQIAFISTRKIRQNEENCNGDWPCIYIMNIVDGRTKALMLKQEVDYAEPSDSGQHLSWSPDGKYLALTVRAAQDQDHASIWIIDLDGNARRLTNGKADDFQPVWQPRFNSQKLNTSR